MQWKKDLAVNTLLQQTEYINLICNISSTKRKKNIKTTGYKYPSFGVLMMEDKHAKVSENKWV